MLSLKPSAQGKPRTPRASGGRRLTLYASIAIQVFALVRNVAVARLLGPEEFGIAAIIILTIAFLDSFSNAGSQNLLVQAKDEDGGPLLAAAHAVSLWRGAATAVLLVLSAGPIAAVFGIELSPMAFYLVALSSLVSGLAHRGVRFVQRDGDFRPDSITQVSANFAAMVVAIPVAMLTHSHIAIVAGLLARSVVTVVVSHLMATQPYKVSWERSSLRRYWTFGWPLLINAPLLFFSAQADRLFISKELGATSLGVYSAVLVLISSPCIAILRWLGTIYMPTLAKFYHKTGSFEQTGPVYNYTVLMLFFGLAMFVGFATIGGTAVHILYGEKFRTSSELIALIGCLQVFRFLRSWPSTLALSAAANEGILISTVIRLIALPIGLAGLYLLGGLPGLVIGFIIGEGLALVVSLVILNYQTNRVRRDGVASTLLFLTFAGLVVLAVRGAQDNLLLLGVIFLIAMAIGVPTLALSVSRSETIQTVTRMRARYLPHR